MTTYTEIREAIRYRDAMIHGGSPTSMDAISQEWADAGFSAPECERWWDAACFDAGRAAVLRDAGITPEQVARPVDREGYEGYSIGYWHSNGDLSLADVLELIAE
jgi:hypothetical protein